jgi:hypothetical protein
MTCALLQGPMLRRREPDNRLPREPSSSCSSGSTNCLKGISRRSLSARGDGRSRRRIGRDLRSVAGVVEGSEAPARCSVCARGLVQLDVTIERRGAGSVCPVTLVATLRRVYLPRKKANTAPGNRVIRWKSDGSGSEISLWTAPKKNPALASFQNSVIAELRAGYRALDIRQLRSCPLTGLPRPPGSEEGGPSWGLIRSASRRRRPCSPALTRSSNSGAFCSRATLSGLP